MESKSCPGRTTLGVALICSPGCAVLGATQQPLSSPSARCHLRAFQDFFGFYITCKIMVLPPCYHFLAKPVPTPCARRQHHTMVFRQLPALPLSQAPQTRQLPGMFYWGSNAPDLQNQAVPGQTHHNPPWAVWGRARMLSVNIKHRGAMMGILSD